MPIEPVKMMVSCTQATGELQEKHKKRDYSGLEIDVIYLRSTDGGKHWEKTAVSPVNFATARDSGKGTHASNGGPTQTIALLAGSRAIDKGSNAYVSAGETDQRGFTRIVNGTVDIGAFEVQTAGATPTLAVSATTLNLGTTTTGRAYS